MKSLKLTPQDPNIKLCDFCDFSFVQNKENFGLNVLKVHLALY